MSVEKFDDMKTALVHVKMNVPFLEIRSHGFPYFRLRIQGLHGTPRGKSETPSMIILRKEEQLKNVVSAHLVYPRTTPPVASCP